MTIRTLQEFVNSSTGLFKDNTAGDIGANDLRDAMESMQSIGRWFEIATSRYTATPLSTSQITMSDTSNLVVGLPVRYSYNSNTYYGVITAVSANASITIAGAALDTGQNLTSLFVGTPEQVIQVCISVVGFYGDDASDLILTDLHSYFRWALPRAYLVQYEATHQTADTGGSQPKVNAKVAGSFVGSQDSNNGIQLSSAGTWVQSSAVAISTSNYEVNLNDPIEFRCTAAGTNTNAKHLSANLIFVLE